MDLPKSVDRTRNALEGDSVRKIKKIEELEKELNDLQSKDMVDSDEAFGWKNRITQLQQELDAAKNKIVRLEATNQTYAQKVKDFSKDLIKAMQKVAQLECKSDEDQEKIKEQRRESMGAYKKAADFETATKVCNSTKNELNSVIQSLRDKIKALEDELQIKALDQVRLQNNDLQQYDSQVHSSSYKTGLW